MIEPYSTAPGALTVIDHLSLQVSCEDFADAVIVHAWQDDLSAKLRQIGEAIGADTNCHFGDFVIGRNGVALRYEAMKVLVLGCGDIALADSCDVSDSMVRFRFEGEKGTALLSRLIDLDTRDRQFPQGRAAATTVHGIDITLVRTDNAFWILAPRTYSRAICEFIEGAGKRMNLHKETKVEEYE